MKTKLYMLLLIVMLLLPVLACDDGSGNSTATPFPVTIEVMCPNSHINGYECIMVTPGP